MDNNGFDQVGRYVQHIAFGESTNIAMVRVEWKGKLRFMHCAISASILLPAQQLQAAASSWTPSWNLQLVFRIEIHCRAAGNNIQFGSLQNTQQIALLLESNTIVQKSLITCLPTLTP